MGYFYIYVMLFILLLCVLPTISSAQTDSVDVTFYYTPPVTPDNIYLRGEFNNWETANPMTYHPDMDRYEATVRLRVGGPDPLPAPYSIEGAYQYKYYYTVGTSEYWVQDPLNPRENPFDHDNSYLYTNDPTIYHLLPNPMSGLVETRTPTISAYLYSSTETEIDPESIEVTVSDYVYSDLSDYFDAETNFLSFDVPEPLVSGTHSLKLVAETVDGSVSADSTEFMVEAGFIRLLTRPNSRHLRESIKVDGIVADDTIEEVVLYHNDDAVNVTADSGFFSYEVTLTEGENVFYAIVDDPEIDDNESDPVTVVYYIDRRPKPVISGSIDDVNVMLELNETNINATNVTYTWSSDDERNPLELGIVNHTGTSLTFDIPEISGEFYIDVHAVGDEQQEGSARTYVRVYNDDTAKIAAVEGNPSWVRDAIVYEIYVPAFASGGSGTFQHVINRLPEIKDLGVNVIWFMPIYDNNENINELNAGYNIADFYSVHPQLGTMEKFDELVELAHQKGIRIILDSTPNHLGRLHPWIDDLRTFRDYSIYRSVIENRLLGNHRGLGHSILRLEDHYPLYARYSNWTLPNLNYQNPETKYYMLEMYRWWLLERNIDGYRMDVYWGPENRYGTDAWWEPFREEIKRVRPDVFILGETDGTGPGSENNYADFGGASDAAYDWNLYGYIKNVLTGSGGGNLNDLHNRVNNFADPGQPYNFHTGENSHIFRFIENHDEPRIAELYGTAKAKAGAVLNLTIPGIPLIYAGQEVGETSRRGTIIWNRTGAVEMRDFFKRLTYSRYEFPAFATGHIIRVSSGNGRVYSYSRPFDDQNAIVAINFSSSNASATLQINDNVLSFVEGGIDDEKTYYLNDVLNDSSATVTKSDLAEYTITLGPWESVVYVLSDTLIKLVTSVSDDADRGIPDEFTLHQNYPNPFNPGTTIRYSLPKATQVTLNIYDMLGRRVATVVDDFHNAGSHQRYFDASHLSSGMYFYRIEAGEFVEVKKMMYVR